MSDLEHAMSLLRMAQRDLNALRGMSNPAVDPTRVFFSDEIFGFHAQQAAEKCLKAWIASLGKKYPRTHDIMALIVELSSAGEDTSNLDSLVDLNPFAVEYRYELLDTDDEDQDRVAVVNEIQPLFDRMIDKIGGVEQ